MTEQQQLRKVRDHAEAVELLAQQEPLVVEKLAYVKAHVRVRRVVLDVAACLDCGDVSKAPLPPLAVPKGNLDATMLAWLAYAKCGLHLPAAGHRTPRTPLRCPPQAQRSAGQPRTGPAGDTDATGLEGRQGPEDREGRLLVGETRPLPGLGQGVKLGCPRLQAYRAS